MSTADPEAVKDKTCARRCSTGRCRCRSTGAPARSPARCSGRRRPRPSVPVLPIVLFAVAGDRARASRSIDRAPPPAHRRRTGGGLVSRALAARAGGACAAARRAASAHALLKATTPERGARLERAPAQVTLRFSEPVEVAFGAVRVFDSQRREVQAGRAFHPGERGNAVAVRLRDGLGEDGYTVTYRVISADSHPVSGGFVFVVGRRRRARHDGRRPARRRARRARHRRRPSAPRAACSSPSIALALGALIFLLACWLPALRAVAGGGSAWSAASAAFAARLRTLLLAAAGAGAAVRGARARAPGRRGRRHRVLGRARARASSATCSPRASASSGASASPRGCSSRPRPPGAGPCCGRRRWAPPASRCRGRRAPSRSVCRSPRSPSSPPSAATPSVQSPVALLLPANVLHVVRR